ncbi:50S ribosomal protein L6, partial [Candidatus Latescibacterota bacterium]
MSRVGNQPIKIPDGVSASVKEGIFTAKSSKGQLDVPIMEGMNVAIDSSVITVSHKSEDKNASAFWGLTRALLNNAVSGVSVGWEKTLEVRGVGYRAQLKGKVLDLQIGQSHPIEIDPPKGIVFETSQESIDGSNVQIIKISGIDKQLVGDVAAKIRALKPPEPYKGKGVRYR